MYSSCEDAYTPTVPNSAAVAAHASSTSSMTTVHAESWSSPRLYSGPTRQDAATHGGHTLAHIRDPRAATDGVPAVVDAHDETSHLPLRRRAEAADTESDPSLRFPPRLGAATRHAMTHKERYYALAQRLVATESCVSLAVLYASVVKALTKTAQAHDAASACGSPHSPTTRTRTTIPTTPSTVASPLHAHDGRAQRWCRAVYRTMVEVEHVCVHRLCQATLPLEELGEAVARLRGSAKEVRVSDYVGCICNDVRVLLEQRPGLATPVMEVLFLRRLLFSVQTTLVREYGKLARKKLMSDVTVMQMQVDVQSLQQQMVERYGRDSVVLPGYVVNLIKTGFYRADRAQGMAWVRQNHRYYAAVDLVNWFGGSDKAYRTQLHDLLTGPLQHEDAIPVAEFIS